MHIFFLPKVVSQFHKQLSFLHSSHHPLRIEKKSSIDVRRALAFYLQCSQPFQWSPHLFISHQLPTKGCLSNFPVYIQMGRLYYSFGLPTCSTSSPQSDPTSLHQGNGSFYSFSPWHTTSRHLRLCHLGTAVHLYPSL